MEDTKVIPNNKERHVRGKRRVVYHNRSESLFGSTAVLKLQVMNSVRQTRSDSQCRVKVGAYVTGK